MKLQKLSIKNFRGLKGDQNIIDFSSSDIIFLLGQNNVGKSSFLRAYEFFVEPKQKAMITDFYDHNVENNIEIEAEFLIEDEDDNDKDLQSDFKKGENAEPGWLKSKWADINSIVKVKKIWDKENEEFKKYTWSPSENTWTEGGLGGLHQNLTKFAPTPIAINAMETEDSLEEKVNKLINDDFLKTAKIDYEDEYKKAEEAVKELQKKVIGSDGIKGYNANINKYFRKVFFNLELEIRSKNEEIKLVDTIKKNHSVNVKKDGCTREETFRQHGHGIIRQALFNFLAFLKNIGEGESQKKEYLILFEEPELFLHPKIAYILRKNLYELAANSPYQVLCASHSPLMIDVSKPKSSLVRIIKSSDDSTITHQVGEELFQKDDEYKKMVQMINRFNSNVCEAFYADTVLLVEGDTEAIVFRDLLERFFPDKEIYVLNTGSKNNIPFFQEVLSHFKINYFVVHDTDTIDKTSAWTLNQKIWGNIQSSESSARRYVFKDTFEVAHNYEHDTSKGKPLSAFEFVQKIQSIDEDNDCVRFLKDICSDNPSMNHDQDYINQLFQ